MAKSRYLNINLALMNSTLTISEAALFSMIDSLSKKKGYCYASNNSFCETLNIKVRTLYRMLNKLEDAGYIKRVTISNGHYGKERKLYVSPHAKMTEHYI
jgi:DNA-binding PadR family transcriptional regulator|tara:strand:- start:502 stop:801 length:300 start_codon:yes stop_codon:yes gene_type:complete